MLLERGHFLQDNLQSTVNLQQTYTTTLCSHINSIYSKLAQLDGQIQTHCLYPHPPADTVQIDAPDYDSNIDGPVAETTPSNIHRVTVSVQGLSTPSDTLSIHAKNTEREDTSSQRDTFDPPTQESTHRFDHQPKHTLDHKEQTLSPEFDPEEQPFQ